MDEEGRATNFVGPGIRPSMPICGVSWKFTTVRPLIEVGPPPIM